MHERKYKIENNQIVRRCDGMPISEDEPLFILRAQDVNALPMIMAYHAICLNLRHQANVIMSIKDFKNFKTKHPERMKEPDSE
jgi:hypothetical protein